MEGFFLVMFAGLAFVFGILVGSEYGSISDLRNECIKQGHQLEEIDERWTCWDATKSAIVPITVTYPLPLESDR